MYSFTYIASIGLTISFGFFWRHQYWILVHAKNPYQYTSNCGKMLINTTHPHCHRRGMVVQLENFPWASLCKGPQGGLQGPHAVVAVT